MLKCLYDFFEKCASPAFSVLPPISKKVLSSATVDILRKERHILLNLASCQSLFILHVLSHALDSAFRHCIIATAESNSLAFVFS